MIFTESMVGGKENRACNQTNWWS